MNVLQLRQLIFYTVFCLSVTSCALDQVVEKYSTIQSINTSVWSLECKGGLIERALPGYLSVNLAYAQRRCEVANRELLSLHQPFSLSFVVSTDYVNVADDQWHIIFQIHSFPDLAEGEKWRCPVISLEVKNGAMRMFNRWDALLVSELNKGTCAHSDNSISSRTVFKDYKIQANELYKIKIDGQLSYLDDGFFRIAINDQVVGEFTGANTFNDLQGPFLKFGIYKPTSWRSTETLAYYYSDFIFFEGKQ